MRNVQTKHDGDDDNETVGNPATAAQKARFRATRTPLAKWIAGFFGVVPS